MGRSRRPLPRRRLEDIRPRAIVVEAADRPDLASAALRSIKRQVGFEGVGAVIALTTAQVARLDPSAGFDDFVLMPYVPAELYARIRALEWRRSEFATEERLKVGEIVVDNAAHEVMAKGRPDLAHGEGVRAARLPLRATRQGALARAAPREGVGHALRRRPAHGRHPRAALRAKLGEEFPLETLRGAGYKLRAPAEQEAEAARKKR